MAEAEAQPSGMEVAPRPLLPAAPSAAEPRGCCRRLRKQPRLLWTLAAASVFGLVLCVALYRILPQLIIQQRIQGAQVNIANCTLQVGPSASAVIRPTVRFSVSRKVLHLPLVSFKASVAGFRASIFFISEGKGAAEDVTLGTFVSGDTLHIDSREDMDVNIAGDMELSVPAAVGQITNQFLKEENVTLGLRAKVDIHSRVWGWLPVPFFGISISKAITIPAFDNFMKKNIKLDRLVSAAGSPGELNVTAAAEVFNPTPVTMMLLDDFEMQVYYKWQGAEYRLGTLRVQAPLTLRPQDNVPMGTVTVDQRPEMAAAMEAFISEYIGPQKGIGPAGAGTKPLLVRMADGWSASPLVQKVTGDLSIEVNFRPKPLYFLSAITADITAFGSWLPPFYKVIVHLRVANPMPEVIYVNRVQLTAHHLSLDGPVLYHYYHDIKAPQFDPSKYVMQPSEEVTLDFELSVLTEVSWDFLFRLSEIMDLIREAGQRNLTVGVSLDLTVTIGNGYQQVIKYRNEALSGQLCFHPTVPAENCGGLPGKFALLEAALV